MGRWLGGTGFAIALSLLLLFLEISGRTHFGSRFAENLMTLLLLGGFIFDAVYYLRNRHKINPE